MPKRQLLSKSISQLEELYRDNTRDHEQLRQIARELEHRRTKRAKKLAGLVARALEGESRIIVAQPISSRDKKKDYASHPASPKGKVSKFLAMEVSEPPAISELPPYEKPVADIEVVTDSSLPPVESMTREKACGVLDAWLALEVLSPRTYRHPEDLAYGDRRLVAELSDQKIPWFGRGEKSRPKKRLFYQVVLGAIDMERASRALLEVYADERIEKTQARGFAAIGALVVDQRGFLQEEGGVAISSFSWGLPLALEKGLTQLSKWPERERSIQRQLEDLLRPCDEEEEPIPLEHAHLQQAFSFLVAELRLDPALIVSPSFAIRTHQWVAIKSPQEAIVLNSFFVDDLIRAREAVEKNIAGCALRRYLRLETPTRRADVLASRDVLESLCAPRSIPPGRWPSAHSLAVLQQAAVNTAYQELEREGILGVNGPPGTGKTTLLRDVVATVVVKRAEVMAAFPEPEKAFKHADKMRIGSAFCHLYELDDTIKGHEIVVASSNNKAVENISKELPEIETIDPKSSLRYFSTLSDATKGEEGSTWGLIAAVLGNKSNQYTFSQAIWSEPDTSLNNYLRSAAGKEPKVEEKDPATGKVFDRQPKIVTAENPPTDKADASRRWEMARRKFCSSLASAREILESLERGREHALALQFLQEKLDEAFQAVNDLQQQYRTSQKVTQAVDQKSRRLKEKEASEREEARSSRNQRPWFFHWLLRTDRWRTWSLSDRQIKKSLSGTRIELAEAEREFQNERETEKQLEIRLDSAQQNMQTLERQISSSRKQIQALRAYVGHHFADQVFWERGHAELHVESPWLAEFVERVRTQVFEDALLLHKAFLDAAAKPIRQNFMALFSIFRGTGLGSLKRDYLIPHLWSSLFLLTPAISTTFASFGRMFGKFPVNSLGWLLVDEAGQALPQAAVGALLRSRRALVVGDPLQIQPIVSLSPDLVDSLFREIGADPDEWAPPLVSAQVLADQANRFVSILEQETGSMLVGLPLVVHRRCQEPMFSISNRIAYGGNMVFASSAKPSKIVDVLGESRWIEVNSSGRGKWSEEEGGIALSLIDRLYRAGLESPDLFVISPFVIVAQELQQRMVKSEAVRSWSRKPFQWVEERVGTVHTFQGKEAEAVIFVLGAPSVDQEGARAWAGSWPNLLNVAITRAKMALYVVGSRQLWKSKGFFSVLDRQMPS